MGRRRHTAEMTAMETEEQRKGESFRFKAASPAQRQALKSIHENEITLLTGVAGTGKSLIASYGAYQLLKSADSSIEKIVIVRLAAETCGERIGALPGELGDKLGYLAAPIVDNLSQIVSPGEVKYLFDKGQIEVVPVFHVRGRSFQDSAIIVEEIQNLDYPMVLTILTRLGFGSKMILTGDPVQTDIPWRTGVRHAQDLLRGLPGVGCFEFETVDVQRHPLVKAVLERAARLNN